MKLHFKLIVTALSLSFLVNSQNSVITKRGCGTPTPSAEWDAWFNNKVKAYKAEKAAGKTQNISVTIPVIVHVIHPGSAINVFPNLNGNQIRSQITVLNKDYGGIGLNATQLAATGFSAVGVANTNITFCLAQFDPNGVALTEPGIERINSTTMGWPNPNTFTTSASFQSYMDGTVKPNTIWDPTYYFNIWISDINAQAELLGYATFPAGSNLTGITFAGNSSTDGIWVWARSFGNTGTLQAPYHLGRTASHEAGHYFGLRHIGGDGNGNPAGDCNATDYCDDTPPQKGGFGTGQNGQNFGAPTYPLHVNVCSSPYGDMFMNFMDYVDDAYCYMFTPDQNDRMQTALANGFFRTELSASASTLCVGLPSANFISDSIVCINSPLVPYNGTDGAPVPTYSWSVSPPAGVVFTPTNTDVSPGITFPATGDYTLTLVATNSIGITSNTMALSLVDCTDLKENTSIFGTVNLAPNPTSGQLTINTSLEPGKNVQVSIYNSLGQVIFSKQYTTTNTGLGIDLSTYPNGIYSVGISTGNAKIMKRLVLNK